MSLYTWNGLPEVLLAVADPIEFRKQLQAHFLLQSIMFTIIGSGSWLAKANAAAALMRASIARANEQLDLRQQLANTPPPQSTTPGLHPVSIH